MAGIMCQVLPSYFNNLSSKCLFISISIETFTQYLVTEQYCVARHNNFCPIENCKSHIILISDSVEDILEKLDNYFYTYQTVDCLYTLFKHQFYNTLVVRKGNVFNQLVTAIKHNSDLKCVEKMPSIAKKRLARKRFKQHFMRSGQQSVSTQTLGSVFMDRVHSIRNSKYEADFLKIIDCLLDGHGSIDSANMTFELKK